LAWGTTFTTRFNPLKNSFSHAGFGVVASLVDRDLPPALKTFTLFGSSLRVIVLAVGILDGFMSPIPRLGIMIKPYRRSSSF
jgi:hypothetical protein